MARRGADARCRSVDRRARCRRAARQRLHATRPAPAEAQPERDWILTRILWLDGCEPGRNRGGEVDTLRRYIYIHGAPDSAPMGVALSHGCIRMRNADVCALFDAVDVGMRVRIEG
ncbi:L,D-transpeptidase [Variovorax guangxiensis]|uniref:L,D-transpeptidase n=1 Tax=Variovorax guangxiensis TaxID=1775474 RepID=UPI001F500007|nr:L,D-transpeptidase [Variovorax guangxiensis]